MDGPLTSSIRAVRYLCALSMVLLSATGMAATTPYAKTTEQLDLKRIRLVVVSPSPWQDALHHRAMMHFTEAELPTPDFDPSQRSPLALLTLTLNPQPIGDNCPGKVLYSPSLTLTEAVEIPRTGAIIQDATWISSSQVQVQDPVALVQIEKDLDRLIDQFIMDYKTVNTTGRLLDRHSALLADGTQPTSLSPDADSSHRNRDIETIRTVRISVLAGQWSSRLKTAAVRQLAEVGIRHAADPTESGVVDMSLELIQQPLGEQCPGHILYERGLYLVEEVRISRRPQIQFWTDTWLQESVQIVPPRSRQELDEDQTELLRTFLSSHQSK